MSISTLELRLKMGLPNIGIDAGGAERAANAIERLVQATEERVIPLARLAQSRPKLIRHGTPIQTLVEEAEQGLGLVTPAGLNQAITCLVVYGSNFLAVEDVGGPNRRVTPMMVDVGRVNQLYDGGRKGAQLSLLPVLAMPISGRVSVLTDWPVRVMDVNQRSRVFKPLNLRLLPEQSAAK